jgi:hypothetical protein
VLRKASGISWTPAKIVPASHNTKSLGDEEEEIAKEVKLASTIVRRVGHSRHLQFLLLYLEVQW